MTEPTKDQLNQILQFLLDSAKDAKGFAMEQAPQVAKEIATYGMVSGWLSVAGLLVLFVIASAVLVKAGRKATDINEHPAFIVLTCLSGVVALVCLLCFADVASDAIKATVAPRLYVLEYVAKLMK